MSHLSNLKWHHTGLASKNLAKEVESLVALGFKIETEIFEDPAQGIRGQFLLNNGFRIEVLEKLNSTSPLDNFINKGIHYYHQGYTTDNFDAALAEAQDKRMIMVSPPTASVFFKARISFWMNRQKQLIEFIERP